MKKFYVALCFILFSLTMYSQTDIFVLVDVSKSVKQSELSNAKQALNEILTGTDISKAFIPSGMGSHLDLVKFKILQGDKLAIVKFGSLQTTIAISPNPTVINNLNVDITQVLNSISWTPTDQQTYLILAKAKIAEYAKNNSITNYKLYIISDNINDDYGKHGMPNYPDDYTRDLAVGYNTSTNPVSEAGYTKLQFSGNPLFTLSLSPNVDVSNYSLPGAISTPIIDTDVVNATIKLISPPKAQKNREFEIKSEEFNINWACHNCPKGIKYTVMVSQYDGGNFKEIKRDLTANTAKFKVPSGKFRITISASNAPVTSDYTYININTGSFGWLVFLLALIVIGSIGYYYWNKKRQEKIDVFATNKSNDIFSQDKGGTTGNSSSSEYF